eukprot:2486370-Prymnesium_polylepis.1
MTRAQCCRAVSRRCGSGAAAPRPPAPMKIPFPARGTGQRTATHCFAFELWALARLRGSTTVSVRAWSLSCER